MFNYDYYENEENDFFDDSWSNNDVREKVFEIESILRKNVRADVLNEMQELERKNKELREQLDQLRDVEKNWDAKKRELDKAIENAKYARLSELIQSIPTHAYCVDWDYTHAHPKCDKCDKDRFIHFKSPSGKDMKELCTCAEYERVYSIKEVPLIRIEENRFRKETAIPVYLVNNLGDNVEGDCSFDTTRKTLEDEDLQNLIDGKKNVTRPIFEFKENAEKYMDYMNEKERKRRKSDENA